MTYPRLKVHAGLVVLLACGSSNGPVDTTDRAVGMVVEVDSDLMVPAIDQIGVEVFDSRASSLLRSIVSLTGSGATSLPLAFELQAGGDPRVTIHVFGLREGAIRVMREIVSVIPAKTTKYLHVQLEWLCAGKVYGTFTETTTHLGSVCPVEHTCQSGACISSDLDSSSLPATATQGVACFDSDGCFAKATPVTPDQACTISLPSGGGMVNVGVVTSADGACGELPCTVPLDHGQGRGWIEVGTTAQLAAGVCSALAAHTITGVVVAACANQKSPENRICPRAAAGDAGHAGDAANAGDAGDTGDAANASDAGDVGDAANASDASASDDADATSAAD